MSESKWGRGAEEERERILSRPHAEHGAPRRAWSHDSGIMTWAEIKSQTPSRLSHSGAAKNKILSTYVNTYTAVFWNGEILSKNSKRKDEKLAWSW